MGNKTYRRNELPANPDPEKYILVEIYGKYYYRRKRGTIKPAVVNASLKKNNKAAKIVAPAASRIMDVLYNYTERIEKRNLHLRVSGAFMRAYNANGKVDYSMLKDMDMNVRRQLRHIFRGIHLVRKGERELKLDMGSWTVRPFNKNHATNYYFELIWVSGDPVKSKRLTLASDSSQLFSFAKNEKSTTLSIETGIRKQPWMLLLFVAIMDNNQMANHPANYALNVIAVGND